MGEQEVAVPFNLSFLVRSIVVDEVLAEFIFQFTVLLSRPAVMQVMIFSPMYWSELPAGSARAGEKSGVLVVHVNSL
jgi:hypothetical protein